MRAKSFSDSFDTTEFRTQESFPSGDRIAIVGMACRFPGSENIAEFWRLLIDGENLVVEGPPGSIIGRSGPLVPESGASNEAVRYGAFLQGIDMFDAEFFRISPIEAQMLDPQQRLMLETSWRAFEDAAIDPDTLRGSRTGVYAGISTADYRDMAIFSSGTGTPAAGLYAATGNSLNTAIGRVSFVFGLEGPAMAIDTACSSSLVAIHQAIRGLQSQDVDLALAGGVMLHLAGRPTELRANAGMLSPQGQCHTFDAAADGFVCGEGCGLLVLKRLREAKAAGDRIWGIIRASVVNHDGASQGLTVPSGDSQQDAMEKALARAELSPADVDYLEAHGTGTVVGDPIELNAAASVLGRDRPEDRPLLIGSVKTNIGHLGAAAGVAGVIKSVLAMKNGVIPRHLNFENPNPNVNWDDLPLRVTDMMMDWPRHADRPPRAAVNSFGWSGTNAHVVVEGYELPEAETNLSKMSSPSGAAVPVAAPIARRDKTIQKRTTRFLPLSAKSNQALREVASQYLGWLSEHSKELVAPSSAAHPLLSDMAWTAATGRSHFSYRSGIAFGDDTGLREKLVGLADGKGVENGLIMPRPPKVAFVFTGHGGQWTGMGRALYEREPVFRSVLDRCDRLIAAERGVSLLDVMFGLGGKGGLLDEPAWTNPAIYALECALVALWESVGIRPDVVTGHSLGEIAASQAAGALTLDEGLRLVVVRGNLMETTRSDGAMAAVFTSAPRVASAVSKHNAGSDDVGVSIAADNGLQQVLSGPAKDIEALQERFEAEGVKVVRLRQRRAYHSALMDPVLEELETAIRGVLPAPLPPALPLISNLTGGLLDKHERMDAIYWRRQVREAVAFRQCVEALAELGVDVVVEIGPHSVLGPLVSMNWPESPSAVSPAILHSMTRPPRAADEPVTDTTGGFVEAVAAAYEAGLDLNYAGLFTGEKRCRISLPGYPFQRIRHWVQSPKSIPRTAGHPLLGTRHELARGEVVFETEMSSLEPAWMRDHLVFGQVVAPGGLYGAMAISVALADGNDPGIVDDLQMPRALIFEEEDAAAGADGAGRSLQLVLDGPPSASDRRFEVFSKGNSEESWVLHAAGMITSGPVDIEQKPPVNLEQLKADLIPQDTIQFYESRFGDHISLGPPFHTLQAVWAREGEALGEIALPESEDASGMAMHPLLLDGCFQVFSIGRYLTGAEQGAAYIPFGWERLWMRGPMPERVLCHALLPDFLSGNETEKQSVVLPEVFTGDMQFYSVDGVHIGGIRGFTVKRARQTDLRSANEELKDIIYEVAWREMALSGRKATARFLADPAALVLQTRSFVEYLEDEGVTTSERNALLYDLECLARAYALSALEQLGWERTSGVTIRPEELRRELKVVIEHRSLFVRILHLLSDAGVIAPSDDGFIVVTGARDLFPEESLENPAILAERLADRHTHGARELGLLRRCGSALAEVLQGSVKPLSLLFSDDGAGAADLYVKAPASRAANNMLGDTIAGVVSGLSADRNLRVVEVGAGTGATTEYVLDELPEWRFDYTFTDISAGFFAQAEARFARTGAPIKYKPLNIELSPSAQGFEAHAHDLLIAANVLHATRDLGETLANCRELLAPSGLFIALEGLQSRAWHDLTFGLLDGWWRFSDAYRSDHALANPAVWHRALTDAGFSDVEFIGPEPSDSETFLGSSVIIARAPAEEAPPPGVWVIAADESGIAAKLANALVSRNQTVVMAREDAGADGASDKCPGVIPAVVDPTQKDSWRSVLNLLPGDNPLKGVVHLMALDGHGSTAKTAEMAEDITRSTSTALALVQGMIHGGASPTDGFWFVTRGGQVLEHDFISGTCGELGGAPLWGFGKVLSLESAHWQPRLIDLDPKATPGEMSGLISELLFPDSETHVAYRGGIRHVARLERINFSDGLLPLPENAEWCILPDDPDIGLTSLRARSEPRAPLRPGEVRLAVEAAGLNFADMLVSTGGLLPASEIGREMYGRVLEIAPDVNNVSVGDRVVGLGFRAFAPETVTRAVMLARVPDGNAASALATLPVCFVTVELAFRISGLDSGERVLIHSGAGGVGLAAIQLVQACWRRGIRHSQLPEASVSAFIGCGACV